MTTGFADPTEGYRHIICNAEGKGLCGLYQATDYLPEDPQSCSVCILVKEMQFGVCPFSEGVKCACLSEV